MVVITSKVEYLLLILVDLATNRASGYTLSRDVAERQGIPPKYMPQLMALLTKRGWAASARGAGGGVRLIADPRDITIKDVIETAGERFQIKPCVDERYPCPRRERCPLWPVWVNAQRQVDRVMESTTLAALIESRGNSDSEGGSQ
ncbi:MAG TPA: Rrf2 family transcriptional regulator [Firmicutes bacterium]|nr:Rrf2 family transcriptional regulator [Bacillota bacterium]